MQFDILLEAIQKREYAFGQPDRMPNPLRDGLLDGYVLYRMCFYAEAYEVFQKLEFEARRTGDFALFFLSQRNRKKIGKLVHWRSRLGDYSKEYGKTIKKEVDSIDLNETLRSIQVENEVQKLLDEIESGKIIQRYSIEIEEKFIKILGTYELYKSEYSSHWGANYPSYLNWEFENLCWFFDSNGLIVDDNRALRKAAEKTFEALVASHQTSKRYESRYSGFHLNILSLCLSWLEQKTLKNILKHYELKEFQFAEGHKEAFVKQTLNFFKSGFVEDAFFGSTSENRLYHDYLQRNAVYEGLLDKHFFPNLLQVLSLTDLSDLPPDLTANLCEAVLTSQRFFPKWMADTANFIAFYSQNLQFFSHPQIQMILDLTANDHTVRPHPLNPLREKLLHFHPDFRISYFGFWENLLKRESDGNLKMEHLSTLFHFREFLEPDQAEQLRKFIQFRLATKLDFDILELYLESLIFELIAKEKFLPTIHGFIRKQFEAISKIQFKPDGEIVPHRYSQGIPEIPKNEYWLTNSLAELNFRHVLHETLLNWLLEQPDLPLSLRWLLNPKGFDYSKFDYYWLFFIKSEKPVFEKLQAMKIKELKVAIQRGLKSRFSEKLSKIYFEYF